MLLNRRAIRKTLRPRHARCSELGAVVDVETARLIPSAQQLHVLTDGRQLAAAAGDAGGAGGASSAAQKAAAAAAAADSSAAAAAAAAADADEGRGGQASSQVPLRSSDHARLPWFLATAFVLSYSYLISISLPFFSTLGKQHLWLVGWVAWVGGSAVGITPFARSTSSSKTPRRAHPRPRQSASSPLPPTSSVPTRECGRAHAATRMRLCSISERRRPAADLTQTPAPKPATPDQPLITSTPRPTAQPTRLPCFFALKLLAQDLSRSERAACRAAIPLTLTLSAVGLVCSASTLARRLCPPGGPCVFSAFARAATAATAAAGGGGGSGGFETGPHGLVAVGGGGAARPSLL